MTTECFILTRAVHFGACLLFFGILAFNRFIAAPVHISSARNIIAYWPLRIRFFSLILLPVILLSGIAWLAFAAMNMSGESLQPEILKTVWTQTQFGTVWKWRSLCWLAIVVTFAMAYCLSPERFLHRSLDGLQLCLAGVLLGTLAWSGHGQENSRWHLFTDILHLLVAGFWPTGLLPFFLLLQKLRSVAEPARTEAIVLLTHRFSALSLISVTLLVATGLVNSWFLAGSLNHLFAENYGRWLFVKILFFLFAIGFGAVNLVRLKPRLGQPRLAESAAAQLRRNIFFELLLATGVIIIVAILGILPPAGH